MKSFLGNFYKHLATFYLSHCSEKNIFNVKEFRFNFIEKTFFCFCVDDDDEGCWEETRREKMEKTKTSCSDSNSNDSAKLLKRFFQQSFRFCFSFNFATCFCGVQSGATSFATSWHLDDFCFFHTKNKQSPKGCHFKMLCDVIQDIQPSMYVQQNWGEICFQMPLFVTYLCQ